MWDASYTKLFFISNLLIVSSVQILLLHISISWGTHVLWMFILFYKNKYNKEGTILFFTECLTYILRYIFNTCGAAGYVGFGL